MLHPEWSYQAVIYEMNVRQLTREGTLRAAAAKLGFLRDMGIDAVWLMPIYPIGAEGRKGSLGSYYSIRDYCAVDPGLGTMGDFDAFVAEAHRLGMKVLLDWVANHTARDARWVGEKPADWYERDAAGAPAVPWDWTDTAKLNYQGLPACIRIPFHKGVCGYAATTKQTVVVKNVHEFPGHIACDGATNSEIVVPILKDDELIGVLDIDSPRLNRFNEIDQKYLEQFVQIIVETIPTN